MEFPRPDSGRARRYRDAGQWRDETIPILFARSVSTRPEKVAVRDASGAQLTYRELDERSNRVAGHLAACGAGAGDIVTVCLPNWCETVVVFVAVLKLGAVVNPVPVTYGRADLAYVLGKCASKALFVPGRFRSADFTALLRDIGEEALAGIAVVRVGEGEHPVGVPFREAAAAAPIAAPARTGADDVAAVLFTSGTESRSKGAVHTHNTILFGERSLWEALEIGENDHAFMASPISHTTGFMHGVVMTLVTGGTLSLLDVFSGAVAAEQMRANRCTWTMGATPFLADVVDALQAAGQGLPDLRYFMCGGAPIPQALAQRATGIGLRVISIYGSTESPPHTVVHRQDPVSNAWETDGRPLAGIEVRIVSGGRDVPDGEVGEEWSRGPNTFIGYLGDPELTRKDLDVEGWYHSGDLARRLPDGSIRIAGRLKEIIVRGGQNISASEVENYLAGHPAVHRAAVVGVPHPRLGETGCAVVVLRPESTLTLEDLTAYLIGKGVARFKLPERLEIWPNLPTTPSGKVQKFLIRKALAEASKGETK